MLSLHSDVDCVAFTGSTSVGRKILQYSAKSNLKKVALECGGKSAFIVLNSCLNIDLAVKVLAKNIFINQGQTCSAPSRLIIESGIYNTFLDKLLMEVDKYAPKNPLDENSIVGSMVSKDQLDLVMKYIESGRLQGAEVLTGGEASYPVKGGYYCKPTIFLNVNRDMKIAQEEIFGPVLSVIKASSISEIINIANDSIYGLSASIWGENINTIQKILRDLKVGTVFVNNYGGDTIAAPFGGYKQSGNGSKDKSLEAYSVYTQKKTIWIEVNHNIE